MKFLFFSLFLTVLRSQQPSLFIDGVAAVIEDNIVLKSDLNQMVNMMAIQRGVDPNEKKILPGKQAVVILAVEQVGNYAVKLRFDDGHDTGIYSWKYLYHLGSQKAEVWSKYLEQLASKGLSRT